MRLHVRSSSIPASGIDDAVDIQNVPRNLLRPRKLEHPRPKLVVDQVIVLELAGWLPDAIASEQIIENLRFADIGDSNDFDIVLLQRKMIEMPTDLSQAHYANADSSVTHLATSSFLPVRDANRATFRGYR
jgi:hypothetical protein